VELMRDCLEKDRKRRLRAIGDARREIDKALEEEPQIEPPPQTRWWRLVVATVAVIVVALASFALGWLMPSAGAGAPTPPAERGWTGKFLLGGTTCAFGSRVSPDGRWLAFTVLHEGTSEVGVMKLDSGDWWVLTRKSPLGGVMSVCWSD